MLYLLCSCSYSTDYCGISFSFLKFKCLYLDELAISAAARVLFITASERPASATAVGCFACNGCGASADTNLHLWFHIVGNDFTPPPLPFPPILCYSLALISSLFLCLNGRGPAARGRGATRTA